jgi:outer membrane lipase/esterase
MKRIKHVISASLAAILLASCGGGGGEAVSKSGVTSIKVVGDSIADSGAFGFKWAMQGNASNPMLIWTERIAASFGVSLCPRYMGTSATSAALNPAATTCTSYAIGSGRINVPAGPTTPFSIPQQLRDLVTEKPYGAGDLLLADGGGNDAADLVTAYLKAGAGIPADFVSLVGSLGVTITAPGAAGLAQAGTLYMQALADKFYNDLKAQALDKGATRIAVLNAPDIAITPRFQQVLDLVALSSGGGTTGAAARTQSAALFKSWVEAYNTRLASKFAGENRVLVVDFFTESSKLAATPAQFGLTNATTPVCPVLGVGSDGLNIYNPVTCTADSLSATPPPAGATGGANWWKTYAFSDGFHFTPYGYQLIGQIVAKELAIKGWL